MIKETTNIRGQIVVFIGFNVTVRAKCDSGNTPYKPAHPPPNTYNISPTMPYIYIVNRNRNPSSRQTPTFSLLFRVELVFYYFAWQSNTPPAFVHFTVCAFWAACIQPCQ